MRIRVPEKADWTGKRRQISFPAGDYTVKREIGTDLVNQGKAEEIPPPRREEKADGDTDAGNERSGNTN